MSVKGTFPATETRENSVGSRQPVSPMDAFDLDNQIPFAVTEHNTLTNVKPKSTFFFLGGKNEFIVPQVYLDDAHRNRIHE
jgi:hypothetical protein